MTDPPFFSPKNQGIPPKILRPPPPPTHKVINNDRSPRNEKGTGAKMPAGCSCFWHRYGGLAGQLLGNFSLFLVTVPKGLCEI